MITLATPMLGPVDCDARAIVAAFSGGEYLAAQVREFAVSLVRRTGECGLRTSLVAAQIAKETGFFRYGGDVQPGQFNFAGLGATGGGAAGASFASIDEGVLAVCEHHLAYVLGNQAFGRIVGLQWPMVDSRLALVATSGSGGEVATIGKYWNGRWAYTPSIEVGSLANGYATGIVAIANTLSTEVPVGLEGVIDLRPRIRAAHPDVPGAGAGYTSAKSGVIIHYNGPATHDAAVDRFISDAGFHQGPYLNEKTIAYIYGIGDEPGNGSDAPVYQLRDEYDVCWHCGSWPENATYTPIAFTFGEGQSAGPGQLRAVAKLVDALRERDGFARENVKGHQEVDSTACPGTLMHDFVYPYRAGVETVSDYVTFAETGHGIGGGFRQFFEHNGSVKIFGYPVSEERDEICEDGVKRTVQYFERNRFEYHPENAAPNDVQLARYGALALKAKGEHGRGID